MGLTGLRTILGCIRAWWPEAVWPQVAERQGGNRIAYDWGTCDSANVLVEDGNGVLRALRLSPVVHRNGAGMDDGGGGEEEEEEKLARLEQAAADEIAEEKQDNAIETPAQLIDYFVLRYNMRFQRLPQLREIDFVFDYMGKTPKIKEILRPPRIPLADVIRWPPPNRDKDAIFRDNWPFGNTMTEYYENPTTRMLLYEYVTEQLLERIPQECPAFSERSACFMIYGGVRKGQPCESPLYVEGNTNYAARTGVLEMFTECYLPAEADLMIQHVVRKHLYSANVLVLSKDSDMIPILLSVTSERYHRRNEPTLADEQHNPRRFNVYWDHRIGATMQDTEDPAYVEALAVHANTPATQNGDGKRKRKPPKPEPPAYKIRLTEIIEFNKLFELVWSFFFLAHGRCTRCDPIDTFATLCFAAGCDYLKKPGLVNFKDLCVAQWNLNKKSEVLSDDFDKSFYPRELETRAKAHVCLCPPHPDGTNNATGYALSYSAFDLLLSRAYLLRRVLPTPLPASKLTIENVRAALLQKRENGAAKRKKITIDGASDAPKRAPRAAPDVLPPAHPHALAANLAWVTHYYTRASIYSPEGNNIINNGLDRDLSTGKSVHGYMQDAKTKCCAFDANVLCKTVY